MSSTFTLGSGVFVPSRDPLVVDRDEVWEFDILDTTDAVIGQLEGVEPGGLTLDFSVHREIRTTGALHVVGDEVGDLRWSALRVAPRYSPDNGTSWWSWGVYLTATPEIVKDGDQWSATIDLYDKLAIPARTREAASYAVDAGDNPITEALAVLALSGSHRVAAEPTSETLSAPMVWDPNTTHLRIINDLAAAANYFSLAVDPSGAFRLNPYARPQDRGVAYTLRSGADAIHKSRITSTQDSFDVPNRVTLTGPSDGETPALVSAPATDNDPASDYSYTTRGYWVDRTETVEATSQSVLDALAARRLIELQSPGRQLGVRFAMLPPNRVWLNSVLRLVDTPSGTDVYGVLQAFTVSSATGAPVEARLTEVAW